MTRNEKGYFVKHIHNPKSLHGKMFHLIGNQKTYDEKWIKDQFKETYIGKNFSFAKNYLYDSILKSLIKLESKKKTSYFYFSSIKVLYDKGLYPNSIRLLKQLLKKSIKENDYLTILQIIQQTKLVLHSGVFIDRTLMLMLDQEAEILNKQQILSTYQSLLAEVKGIRIQKGILNEKNHIKKIRLIQNHEYLNDERRLIDENCRQLFHEILFLCGFLLQDSLLTKRHIGVLQKALLFPEEKGKISSYRKIELLKQLIRYHTENRNDIDLLETMSGLKIVLDNSQEINQREWIEAYGFLYSAQTNLLLLEKNVQQTEVLFSEINLFVKKHGNKLPSERKMVLNSNMLILHFMNKNYKEVLRLTNTFLNSYREKVRKDIATGIMLIEIVVCYELEEIELFESRLISFRRHFIRSEIKEISWKLYEGFLQELLTGKNIKRNASELLVELENVKHNSIASNFHFLVDWVKEKAV